MEETVRDVVFETRYHASRPFSSNYPPQQLNDGAREGLLSLLSARGVSQLKEKWNEYKRPRKLKKFISLFISPSGQHIAVAVGNQIIVLHKDDDYKEPCGIFTNDRMSAFIHGAWSDFHDVLGVIDEVDTLYFIKPNGDDIARITKQQLKISVPIIGLISQNDPDAKSSCLCGFNILTSDGLLHYIEVSRQSDASVTSIPISSNRASLKKNIPRRISCLDFHSEFSLLVVVGSADDNGFYFLSLGRISRNADLDLVFHSPQFEGFVSAPKGYMGTLSTPKVLFSPLGKYVAVLDLMGGLDVFSLDSEQCSLSIIECGQMSYSHTTSILSGRGKFYNDVVDFTWWSDDILVLAERSGVVTMIDILSGVKCMENDPVFTVSVLERVQQHKGFVFLLTSSETSHVASDSIETTIVHDIGQTAQGQSRFNRLDIAKSHWSLMSFSAKSVSEMCNILLSNQEYQAAMDFANQHGLDKDKIFKLQWLHSNHGRNDINMFLSNIKDQDFVLSECVDKVGPTEDAVKDLIAYGLRITDRYRFSESETGECRQIWDSRVRRLQLLQFKDRLETFIGINMGRFSVQEYCKFRVVPLNEAAVSLAESGKIGALNLLLKRHPYSLGPFLLDILAAIPETVPVQTYGQLLPGRSPMTAAVREKDWVESEKMVNYIKKFSNNHENVVHIRTEFILNQCLGFVWPSIDELSLWYKNRAREIDSLSGQLDNCLRMVEFACQKGLEELQQFHEDISYLYSLIYTDGIDDEVNVAMSLVAWEQLSDFEKFKMMLKGVKEDKVVERLREKAIPFMQHRSDAMASVSGYQGIDDQHAVGWMPDDSFLVRWLLEISAENYLDICLMVIEEGCRNLQIDGFFKDGVEAIECALRCIYLCTLNDRWNTMASILSKIPQIRDTNVYAADLEKRIKLAEGHVEAGRLLAYYQVPKPISFFLEAGSDEKGVKQILRLILSKFGRRNQGKSDNDWANMWRDLQCLQEKAFPFLDLEYVLMEFCRGLLKAGKFSLARNYLKGTGAVSLATEKAENLVIQAAREYFYSASSLACSEIWKAKECLNLFPNSTSVKAEADVIDAFTIKLPSLGVTLLPLQFRQIKDPMEIINMVITGQRGAYLNVDELIEIAKLLGLSSQDEIAAVQEAVAREAAVSGDLQLAFDLCLVLVQKGHGPIWDLSAAIARGPVLDNMDISSRKQLLGFALSHCDEESIGELLHAWKDLDMQSQCERLMIMTGTSPPNFSVQNFSITSLPIHSIQDIVTLRDCSEMVGVGNGDQEVHFENIKNILFTVAKELPNEKRIDWDSLLKENGKVLTFAALQLPWLLELSRKPEYGKKKIPGMKTLAGKPYMSVRTQAVVCILSWLARNDIVPSDDLIASLAKSIVEPPVTEEEDILGCSFLLNLVDAFHGKEIIEEQLRTREAYHEISSIMNMGMLYSSLHNFGVECDGPFQRRELLLQKFQEKHKSLSSDAMVKIDEVQSTFWRDWKSKLEEQKRMADQSRALEQLIPGVETARFFSGDFVYIESVVLSLIDSVKLEKKSVLKEALKLADTYGLKQTEVLLRFFSSVLVSEVWTNDDIVAETSEHRDKILACAAEVIKTIFLIVYPAIDGCNKQRIAYIYSILCDCYLQLEKTEEPLLVTPPDLSDTCNLGLTQLYRTLEQECRRVSFIKNLNFKNIAGLGGLKFECFSNEVCKNIDEFSVEALAKMVQNLVSMHADSECLVSWQEVYKHYVMSLLATLDDRTKIYSHPDPENFQRFISELEQNYDHCRFYIGSLSQSDVLNIMWRYFTSSLLTDGSSEKLRGDSAWLDCLISLLNFWIRMTDDMQGIAYHESSEDHLINFNPKKLCKCLKVFSSLVMEEKVLVSQGWHTVHNYAKCELMNNSFDQVFIFCKAMAFSGCGFGAIAEVFSEAMVQDPTSSNLDPDNESDLDYSQNLPQLYINILNSVLLDLASESTECLNLHYLLSSLSKLEGNLDNLEKVRYAVWGRLGTYSGNMQLQNHVRVYALELMQSIMGRNHKGPSEPLPDVQSWEGWDEVHATTASSKTSNLGGANVSDASSLFTNTLIALRSTQLAAAISPNIEISSDDLLTLDSAVSCFLNFTRVASTESHLDALQAILEEWEGLFSCVRNEEDSCEAAGVVNNWNSDKWDEGWESFQEEPVEKEGKNERSLSVHPLHMCWMEIIEKLVVQSRFVDVIRLMDHSLLKPNGVLLNEDSARSLSHVVAGMDCFVALKIVLLLPYEAVWLECLQTVEAKLKQEGITNTRSEDHELFILILSSGLASNIATNSIYCTTFSYLCYLVGHFARLCQEVNLSRVKSRAREETNTGQDDFLFLFRRILFPCFISELVKTKQQLLAGFFVTQFMHTHASFSLINIAEASLTRYLEGMVRLQECDEPILGENGSCRSLVNTISRLRGKLGSLIQSASSCLSTNMK
ncbi:MAG2-interacting protein 2 [Telopea speciosissima]|uniref:MAG2-interacting protein 2 n=1 Tax=Telopea speciosissima TaxID=54955 RepID=UPI001CC6479E|nr:MAG2-interacting protein 2 [Telopea speciosissima]